MYLINVKTVMLKNKQNRAPIDDKKIETRRIFGCSEQCLGNTSSKNVSNTRPTGFQPVSSQVDILPQRNACLTELLKCQTRTIHKDVEKSDAMTSLIKGELSRADYISLLYRHFVFYKNYEDAIYPFQMIFRKKCLIFR